MGLRKASAYSKKYNRPYTRKSNKKSKSYIKTIPPQKIVKFRMGDIIGYLKGRFKFNVILVSGENIMIRDNALESARQFVHKILDTNLQGQYYYEVCVVPHHILRENKVLTGAGADRMSSGMQRSFGSPIGKAAMVKKNQKIFLVGVNDEKAWRMVLDAYAKIRAKLPCHVRTIIEKTNLNSQETQK
ncbi:MAG: 50S ribosomal protein L16 [Candidatus Pacearchaeota archaeon]|nr:50S ribosomal protein L16 [Candidatus Pacearchaeota archaeon]